LVKGGLVHHHGSKSGQQKYQHRFGDRKRCGWHGTQPVGVEEAQSQGVDRAGAEALHATIKGAKRARYVITAAQNATPVNKPFFASLIRYCAERDAQLIIIPYRYKNPTSMWSQQAKDDDWWAPELAKYLLDIRVDLNPNLTLMADIKTQPTANSPLQGFETLTGPKSAIIGHPKLELSTVPTPQSKMAKILTTTGAVTAKNYLNSKAGKKGEHHHTFGACVVEVDGKRFHLRQLNSVKDGSFIDLDTEYSGKAIRKVRAAGLVMGDTHVDVADPKVTKATFDKGGIVAVLRPRELVWHDVLDFGSGTHHHNHDPFAQFAKFHARADDVEAEVDRSYAYIDKHSPPDVRNKIIPSNHHDQFTRWVRETDPRTNPRNAVFWARTFEAMCLGSKMVKTGPATIDPFAWWAKHKLKCINRTKFLSRNDSHLIAGIEVNFHGDAGPNGSRGTRNGFTRIGAKTVIGHSHSPGIKDGCYQVGTSSFLGLAYQRGPSSWLQCHAALYPNGKRSLIFIVNGFWRA
jgi:hypothetical protein